MSTSPTTGFSNNYDFNVNYQFKGDDDLLWNVDLNYSTYERDTDNEYLNSYFSPIRESVLSKNDYSDDQITNIDIYTGQLDHERKLGKMKLSTGLKSSYVQTENVFNFFNVQNGQNIFDMNRSNEFVYTEMVNAAYASINSSYNKWTYTLGLRFENSETEGELETAQATEDKIVKNSFNDFFPSGGLSYQLNPKHSFQLNFGRRIDRPNYQNLNPFIYQINELASSTGNPFLRPQYTYNFQLSHTFNYRYSTTLRYSHTNDLISRFSDIDPRNDEAEIFTWNNLDRQRNVSLNFSAPITIMEWWNSYSSLTLYSIYNDGDFGDGKVVDIEAQAFNFYSQQTFTLPKKFILEVSGWYGSSALWGGNYETGPMWSLNAGIQKRFWQDKAVIKIAIDDIFKTMEWSAESTLGALFVEGFGGWDSRRIKASFNYSFGNQKVKSRKRNTGAEDVKKRTSEDDGGL